MEIKKTPKADLENKKGMFLEIGLAVSLGLVIALFAWSQSEKKIEAVSFEEDVIVADMAEVTRQEQKKPEPVKQTVTVVSDIINVVKNTTEITQTLDFQEFDEDAVVIPPKKVEEEEIEDDAPFIIVETMPKFRGGDLNTFRNWVSSRLKYPVIAQDNGIQGRVFISFVVERDGSLTNIEILQSPDRSLSDEAERVLKTSPKWTPGKQRSTPVRVKYTMPVDFILQ